MRRLGGSGGVVMGDLTKDLITQYLQNYWDAGNLLVTAIFGAAFATYVTFATSEASRILAKKYYGPLVRLACIGNGALLLMLLVISFEELLLLREAGASYNTIWYSALVAAAIKVMLFLGNFGLYLRVLWRIKTFTVSRG
jgi:hypothetical protein